MKCVDGSFGFWGGPCEPDGGGPCEVVAAVAGTVEGIEVFKEPGFLDHLAGIETEALGE